MSRPIASPLLLVFAASGLLASCGDSGPQFPPACPSLALLRDAGDLSRYAGSGLDLRDLALQATITAVPATCTWAQGRTRVRATVQVNFKLTRGPAAGGRVFNVPYFVAVSQSDRILDEQDYTLAAAFAPNTDTTQQSGQKVDMLLPVSREQSAAAYQIYVGFRLSPDELAANRQQRGR